MLPQKPPLPTAVTVEAKIPKEVGDIALVGSLNFLCLLSVVGGEGEVIPVE